MKHDVEAMHPILDAATQMVIDLYEREPNERTRKRLIELEDVLRRNLDRLNAIPPEDSDQ